jgi:hypothetical protein
VDFGLAGNILIGSVPGVWVGSRWSVRVPAGALRPALALLLIGAGLALLAKADVVAVPTAVLAAFPVVVGLLFGASVLWRRRTTAARSARSLAAPAGPRA